MIDSEFAGSRLPVGSSASRMRGRFTNARGHRDALLLTAGEFARQTLGLVRESDEIENLRHLGVDRRARTSDHFEREGHVLKDGLVGKEAKILKDAANIASKVGNPPLGQFTYVASGFQDPTLVR